jgi:ribosome modulation factor
MIMTHVPLCLSMVPGVQLQLSGASLTAVFSGKERVQWLGGWKAQAGPDVAARMW